MYATRPLYFVWRTLKRQASPLRFVAGDHTYHSCISSSTTSNTAHTYR